MQEDHFTIDAMHVAVPRAAGIDVHKMEVTASVRLCEPGQPDASMATRTFGTHPSTLRDLTDWLHAQRVEAATMEGTGIYWIAPFRALEEAGIRPMLVHAQHVQQINRRLSQCTSCLAFLPCRALTPAKHTSIYTYENSCRCSSGPGNALDDVRKPAPGTAGPCSGPRRFPQHRGHPGIHRAGRHDLLQGPPGRDQGPAEPRTARTVSILHGENATAVGARLQPSSVFPVGPAG